MPNTNSENSQNYFINLQHMSYEYWQQNGSVSWGCEKVMDPAGTHLLLFSTLFMITCFHNFKDQEAVNKCYPVIVPVFPVNTVDLSSAVFSWAVWSCQGHCRVRLICTSANTSTITLHFFKCQIAAGEAVKWGGIKVMVCVADRWCVRSTGPARRGGGTALWTYCNCVPHFLLLTCSTWPHVTFSHMCFKCFRFSVF